MLAALLPLLPLVAACICLGGSRRLPARALAFGGAAGLLAALLVLALLWLRGGGATAELLWAALGDTRITFQLKVDALSAPLLAILYGGGALLLLSIGLTFAPSTRGFGGLIAALLLSVLGSTLALTVTHPLLFPIGWGLAALAGYAATRAAGTAEGAGELPAGLVVSLLATLALLVALLLGDRPATALGQPLGLALTAPVLGFLLLAGLGALGLPPLHAGLGGAAAAPAGLAALTVGLGLPLLGGYTLLRLGFVAPALPAPWPLVAVALGLLGSLGCGAAALAQGSPRQLLGWQVSAQGGVMLAALGAGGLAGLAAATLLLLNMALVAVSGFLALALLERRTGRDALEELPRLRAALPLAGLAFAVAACAALGLPPTPGFWGRLWLIGALQGSFPWAPALVIAASALAAPAWLGPLVAFWRRDTSLPSDEHVRRAGLLPLPAALLLLALGVAPQIVAWRGAAPLLPGTAPPAPSTTAMILLALLALAIIVGALLFRSLPVMARLEEERAALPAPEGLAESVGWLRALAAPAALWRVLWQGLLLLAEGARRVLTVFEQRYYLAGVLLALISLLLLIAQ